MDVLAVGRLDDPVAVLLVVVVDVPELGMGEDVGGGEGGSGGKAGRSRSSSMKFHSVSKRTPANLTRDSWIYHIGMSSHSWPMQRTQNPPVASSPVAGHH